MVLNSNKQKEEPLTSIGIICIKLDKSIYNKFINNLYLSETNFCNKFLIDTKSQLYRLYYKYKFTDIIFINSLLDNEEYQFIDEFGNHINIFIYIDLTHF